jgi:hypothetical protein
MIGPHKSGQQMKLSLIVRAQHPAGDHIRACLDVEQMQILGRGDGRRSRQLTLESCVRSALAL